MKKKNLVIEQSGVILEVVRARISHSSWLESDIRARISHSSSLECDIRSQTSHLRQHECDIWAQATSSEKKYWVFIRVLASSVPGRLPPQTPCNQTLTLSLKITKLILWLSFFFIKGGFKCFEYHPWICSRMIFEKRVFFLRPQGGGKVYPPTR